MKGYIVASFLLLAVLVFSSSAEEILGCQDGEVIYQNCNKCRCVNGLLACTKKFCVPPKTKREVDESSQLCKQGDTKKVKCNNCVCGANGKWGCTLKFCL